MKRKNLFSAFWAMVLAGVLFTAAVPSNVFAAGTTAGTVISAQASVQFTDGPNVRNKVSNTNTLTVRQFIDASFTGGTVSGNTWTFTTNGLDHRTVYQSVTFTNTGNQYDYFKVTFMSTPPSGFSNFRLFKDNGDGVWGAAVGGVADTLVDAVYFPADGAVTLLLAFDINTTPTNGMYSVSFGLQSQSNASTSHGGSAPQNMGAIFNYVLQYTVKKPNFAYTVTQSNTANPIPGTAGSISITYQNNGDAELAGNTALTITLPDQIKGSTSSAGPETWTYAAALPSGTPTYGGTITVTIPSFTIASGEHTITIPFTIEQDSHDGTGAGSATAIGTTAYSASYGNVATPGPGVYTASATPTVTGATSVAASKGAMWTIFPATQTADANETIETVLQIKNLGNTTTTFDLSQTNGSGSNNVAHVFSMTSQGTSITSTTPAIAPGATQTIYTRVTTPNTFAGTNTIERNLTVTSAATGATDAIGMTAANYTKKITTSFGGSTLSVVLTSSKSNPLPGDVVEYTLTLTNSKSEDATNVLITLPIDSHLTFQAGAETGNDFNITDGSVVLVGNQVTTTSAFTVPASDSKVIKYMCKVN